MGLLDGFNMDDPQAQGLLSAAAQMLQQSGPSRMPTSLGQILGGGYGAYSQSMLEQKKRKQEEEQAAQIAQLRALSIQEAQGGLQDKSLARAQAEKLRDFYTGVRTDGALQAMGGDPMQTGVSSPQMPSIGGAGFGAVGGSGATGSPYDQRMRLAEQLRSRGFHAEADAQEAAALKFKPEFSTSPQVGKDEVTGKPFLYVMDKDGTQKRVGGTMPRDEMKLADLGGRSMAYDPYALKPGQSFQKTATAGELLSNSLGRDRLNNEKSQQNRPEWNNEVGAFITRPTAVNPNGMKTDLAGFVKPAKDSTEFQGKSSAFGLRATEANKILESIEGKYNPAAINSKTSVESVPILGGAMGAATNLVLSQNDQKAEQAQRDFINAVLRQESGAAIGASEFDNAKKQYFPQPGDGPDVIAQKAVNRRLSIQGLQANAGRAALTAPAASGGWSITRSSP